MSIETDLVARIGALFAGRVFPDTAPFATARPYCTYQQVGGDAPAFVDKTVPADENALMQINVWGDNRLQVNALARQIESLLTTATAFDAKPTGAFVGTVDQEVEPVRYGTMQDFSIWSQRT